MTNYIFLGIDPGKKGGFAFIKDDKEFAFIKEYKAESYSWDDAKFVQLCNAIHREAMTRKLANPMRISCCLEKVGAMPGQGVTSMFSFGKSAGFIEGVLQACEIPYQLITPQKWKKEFMLNSSKQKSCEVCRKLFPTVNLKRTPRCRIDDDGMAEALLMAEYARRKL